MRMRDGPKTMLPREPRSAVLKSTFSKVGTGFHTPHIQTDGATVAIGSNLGTDEFEFGL